MKPNHICKYSKCDLGENGQRKKYYACVYCDTSKNWKSMACCKEHYNLYIEEVKAARENNEYVDVIPDRIDKTKEETIDIMNMSLEDAAAQTKEELKEYSNMIDEVGITETVEKINEDINKKRTSKKSTKK